MYKMIATVFSETGQDNMPLSPTTTVVKGDKSEVMSAVSTLLTNSLSDSMGRGNVSINIRKE